MISKPLQGIRVLNTRALHQAEVLDEMLKERGALPLSYPSIAIHPPHETDQLDASLRALASGVYDWLVLTSANTVLSIAARLEALGVRLPVGKFQLAAVGPSTARQAEHALGLRVHVLPKEFIADALIDALPVAQGTRVLLPESALAKPALADGLRGRGAIVDALVAYENAIGEGGVNLKNLVNAGYVDAITFTSASTVHNLIERLNQEGGIKEMLRHIPAACIGPKTAQVAESYGLHVIAMPESHTLEGLVEALEAYFLNVTRGR